jgi:preprotein translocase subunit SecA
MRIFGGEQISSLMDRLNLPEDQPIENRLISRSIEQAQVKVEGFHFDARKNLVEYDNVINQQREIIYKLRLRILESANLKDEVLSKLDGQVDNILSLSTSAESNSFDTEKILVHLMEIIPFDDASKQRIKAQLKKSKNKDELKEFLSKLTNDVYVSREKELGEEVVRQIEKFAYLGSIDKQWIDHIDHLDGLREGVRLRAYGQRNPLVEFKNEAFGLFEGLIDRIDQELAHRIFRIGVARVPTPEIKLEKATTNIDTADQTGLVDVATPELGAEKGQPAFARASAGKPAFAGSNSTEPSFSKATEGQKKLGRNDPCWCGSGKKWKKCHYPQMG